MPQAKTNGVELCYETFGSSDDPAVLLIMGLGAQMIAWPDEFCETLVARGFHVIRFDNRDVGLSTKLDDAGLPDLGNAFAGDAEPPYTLDDMATDAVGLLDALGIDSAHVVGASMGGMIAQLVAIKAPQRTLSLTSIMSTPGGPDAVPPTDEAMAALLAPPPQNREEAVELTLRTYDVIGGPGFPKNEARLRDLAERSYDRCHYPAGLLRQMVAILTAPSRIEALGGLRMPATVIHGTDDPLVPPENGRRTAEAIPAAKLVTVPGMGHDLPEGAWATIIDATCETTGQAAAHGST